MYLPTSLYVDLPNLFYGAQQAVPRRSALHPIRLQYGAVMRLALAGHPLVSAVAVTTQRESNGAALDAAVNAGFTVYRSEPGAFSGKEQNVDERLQLEMYRASRKAPARVVLLTGDGNSGSDEAGGFIPAIEALAEAGSRVELLAWQRSCSQALQDAVHGAGGVVNFLDTFFRSVTFEQHGRCSEPLNLRRRRNLPCAA